MSLGRVYSRATPAISSVKEQTGWDASTQEVLKICHYVAEFFAYLKQVVQAFFHSLLGRVSDARGEPDRDAREDSVPLPPKIEPFPYLKRRPVDVNQTQHQETRAPRPDRVSLRNGEPFQHASRATNTMGPFLPMFRSAPYPVGETPLPQVASTLPSSLSLQGPLPPPTEESKPPLVRSNPRTFAAQSQHESFDMAAQLTRAITARRASSTSSPGLSKPLSQPVAPPKTPPATKQVARTPTPQASPQVPLEMTQSPSNSLSKEPPVAQSEQKSIIPPRPATPPATVSASMSLHQESQEIVVLPVPPPQQLFSLRDLSPPEPKGDSVATWSTSQTPVPAQATPPASTSKEPSSSKERESFPYLKRRLVNVNQTQHQETRVPRLDRVPLRNAEPFQLTSWATNIMGPALPMFRSGPYPVGETPLPQVASTLPSNLPLQGPLLSPTEEGKPPLVHSGLRTFAEQHQSKILDVAAQPKSSITPLASSILSSSLSKPLSQPVAPPKTPPATKQVARTLTPQTATPSPSQSADNEAPPRPATPPAAVSASMSPQESQEIVVLQAPGSQQTLSLRDLSPPEPKGDSVATWSTSQTPPPAQTTPSETTPQAVSFSIVSPSEPPSMPSSAPPKMSPETKTLPEKPAPEKPLKYITRFECSSSCLKSLPDSIRELVHLEILFASGNQFTAIPDWLFQCPLLYVQLYSNDITRIQAEIGMCTTLVRLDVSNNKITEVDPAIGRCVHLTKLSIQKNKLRSFPEEIGDCVSLKALNLENNPLIELPSSITRCLALDWFSCAGTGRQVLPEWLGDCSNLRQLLVDRNQLTTIPSSLSRCSRLEHLKCSSNLITSLPITFRAFPRDCEVLLEDNPLSQSVLHQLLAMVDADEGPRVFCSMPRVQPIVGARPELVIWVFKTLCPGTPLATLDVTPVLQGHEALFGLWLELVTETVDFRMAQRKPILARRVLEIFQFALEHPSYREVLVSVLEEATVSCCDNVALSINTLEIYRKSSDTAHLSNKELLTLMKGLISLEVLSAFARQKVGELRFVDEIEVYLALQVRLRAPLQLPIEETDMMFGSFSGIREGDLNVVTAMVMEAIRPEALTNKLITLDAWKDRIETAYRGEWDALQERMYRALEDKETDYAEGRTAIQQREAFYREKTSALIRVIEAEGFVAEEKGV